MQDQPKHTAIQDANYKGTSASALQHTHTHTKTALERKRIRSMALCVLRTSPVDGDDADTFFSNLPEAGPPANQTQRKP